MQPPRPKVDPSGAYCAQAFRLDEQRRLAVSPSGSASKSLLQQFDDTSQQIALEECRGAATSQRVPMWNRAIGLVALGIPGLALWILAFILAGSFWRPPSTRTAGSQAIAR